MQPTSHIKINITLFGATTPLKIAKGEINVKDYWVKVQMKEWYTGRHLARQTRHKAVLNLISHLWAFKVRRSTTLRAQEHKITTTKICVTTKNSRLCLWGNKTMAQTATPTNWIGLSRVASRPVLKHLLVRHLMEVQMEASRVSSCHQWRSRSVARCLINNIWKTQTQTRRLTIKFSRGKTTKLQWILWLKTVTKTLHFNLQKKQLHLLIARRL